MIPTPGVALDRGWSLASAAPNRVRTPADFDDAALTWLPAIVPGTVAQSLQALQQFDFDRPRDFDADDWWYRCAFEHEADPDLVETRLRFEGLATLADVWLNGVQILRADNMFRAYILDVGTLLARDNDLVIGFRSLGAALTTRRPRPQWKTRLVQAQQLRWFRTTLLGRIPGWSPPVAPVGPWRRVTLEQLRAGDVIDVDVHARLAGDTGVAHVACSVVTDDDAEAAGTIHLLGSDTRMSAERGDRRRHLSGRVEVKNPAPWWPHTHGRPSLHRLEIETTHGGVTRVTGGGSVGFRSVDVRQDAGGFSCEINGAPVFCRGGCWTTHDIVSLAGSREDLAPVLTRLRDAGANMIRVGGTMVYESDDFYQLCDELGLLVWQDFMFANMDYPADDDAFLANARAEAEQQLRRLRRHPSIAIYCGNSEVEQQAAMLGMERARWRNALFSRVLPAVQREWHPDVAYLPSTPYGGDLPFHVGTGVAHYYGVGAYRRPIADVRRDSVAFTSECLAFANVPEPDAVGEITPAHPPVIHDPRWKQRTPRDSGAGWDFEDVRDHYLRELFAVDPVVLRSADPLRYLELSRVTSAEVMARVFAEWRSSHSRCGGGLVWFLLDLWPGAGWGVLDSRGRAKSCYYALRRVWQPRAVVLTDEGLDGLHVHVINESDEPWAPTLELRLVRRGQLTAAHADTRCELPPRGRLTFSAETLLGGFHDITHAYRFGPPAHDVVAATLRDDTGAVASRAFWLRDAAAIAAEPSGAVMAEARVIDASTIEIAVASERFLCAARLDTPDFEVDDNYFHVLPGEPVRVRARARHDPAPRFTGAIEALNLDGAVTIDVRTTPRLVTP